MGVSWNMKHGSRLPLVTTASHPTEHRFETCASSGVLLRCSGMVRWRECETAQRSSNPLRAQATGVYSWHCLKKYDLFSTNIGRRRSPAYILRTPFFVFN